MKYSQNIKAYEVKKKRENLLRILHRRRKNFIFIYDVIVKQKCEKRPANDYCCSCQIPFVPCEIYAYSHASWADPLEYLYYGEYAR